MTLIGFAVFWLKLSHATFLHIAWGQVKKVKCRTKPHWDKTPLGQNPTGQNPTRTKPHWDKTPLGQNPTYMHICEFN